MEIMRLLNPLAIQGSPRRNIILIFYYVGFKNAYWTHGTSSPSLGNVTWQEDRWNNWIFDDNTSVKRYFAELTKGTSINSRITFLKKTCGSVNLTNNFIEYMSSATGPYENNDDFLKEVLDNLKKDCSHYRLALLPWPIFPYVNHRPGVLRLDTYEPIVVCICRSLSTNGIIPDKFIWPCYFSSKYILDNIGMQATPMIVLPEEWSEAVATSNNWCAGGDRLIAEVFCHELGHHFGWEDQYDIPNAAPTEDYDIMHTDTRLPFTTLFNRMNTGWIPSSQLVVVTTQSQGAAVLLSPIEKVFPRPAEKIGLMLVENDLSLFCVEYRQHQNGHLGDSYVSSTTGEACVLITKAETDWQDPNKTTITKVESIKQGDSLPHSTYLGLFTIEVTRIDTNYPMSSAPEGQAEIRFYVNPNTPAVTMVASQSRTGGINPVLEISNALGDLDNRLIDQLWAYGPNTLSAKIHNVGTGDANRVRLDWNWIDLRSNILASEPHLIDSSFFDVKKDSSNQCTVGFIPPYYGPIGLSARLVSDSSKYLITGIRQANTYLIPLRVPLDGKKEGVRQKINLKTMGLCVNAIKLIARHGNPWFEVGLDPDWISTDENKLHHLEMRVRFTESPSDKLDATEHECDFWEHLILEVHARASSKVDVMHRLLRTLDVPILAGYTARFAEVTVEAHHLKGNMARNDGRPVLRGNVVCSLSGAKGLRLISSPVRKGGFSILIPKGWKPTSLDYVPAPGYLDAHYAGFL